VAGLGVIAGWVAAIVALAGILGVLIRLSFQVGQLVQRFGDHVISADKIHGDQETRIRALEHRPARRQSGGHV
jgi:hypothetical protein